jgi:hypothetical protein
MNHTNASICLLLAASTTLSVQAENTENAFNPRISLILDGRFASYNNDAEDYKLPGFLLGGEAGLAPEGFSLGHSELTLSANIDDKFYGQFSLAFAEHGDEISTEVEEAFFETTGLGYGLTIRGGRFFSGLGYLNLQHEHAWDFGDAPLVYSALFGNKYLDDGLRVSWIAPSDLFIELGAELFSGKRFPAAGEHTGVGSKVAFINFGDDIGTSHSWQAGLSYFNADVENREAGGHAHGHEGEEQAGIEVPSFSGDSDSYGLNFIYKWAPNGNYKNRNFKLQTEFFQRDEKGTLSLIGSEPLEQSTFDGDQSGYYIQAIYQFSPQWRTGLRYDQLDSDNYASDDEVLEEAGLSGSSSRPERASIMLEWLPSEFSRIRLQYNRDDANAQADDQFFLQYTFSLGSHGSHTF